MATIGTPVLSPQTSTTSCEAQGVVRHKVSKVEGIESPSRMGAVQVNQNQRAKVHWTMRSQAGDPVDLASCAPNYSSSSSSSESASEDGVQLRAIEALSSNPVHSASCSTIDAALGLVEVKLPACMVANPGVYIIEFAVLDSDDTVLFSNSGRLIVNRGLFGASVPTTGLPTLQEIRTRLRDSGAEDNFLLNNIEFDDAEIADALVQVVRFWNESNPPVGVRFTTTNFPFIANAWPGVLALLYRTASLHYLREDVEYSAAGVSFNDKRKFAEYSAVAERRWAEYVLWTKREKIKINIGQGFGGIGSPYAYIGQGRW